MYRYPLKNSSSLDKWSMSDSAKTTNWTLSLTWSAVCASAPHKPIAATEAAKLLLPYFLLACVLSHGFTPKLLDYLYSQASEYANERHPQTWKLWQRTSMYHLSSASLSSSKKFQMSLTVTTRVAKTRLNATRLVWKFHGKRKRRYHSLDIFEMHKQ